MNYMNDYQRFIALSRYARWIEEENRREKLTIMILGIMVMLESVQMHKRKNRGKQRTKIKELSNAPARRVFEHLS